MYSNSGGVGGGDGGGSSDDDDDNDDDSGGGDERLIIFWFLASFSLIHAQFSIPARMLARARTRMCVSGGGEVKSKAGRQSSVSARFTFAFWSGNLIGIWIEIAIWIGPEIVVDRTNDLATWIGNGIDCAICVDVQVYAYVSDCSLWRNRVLAP